MQWINDLFKNPALTGTVSQCVRCDLNIDSYRLKKVYDLNFDYVEIGIEGLEGNPDFRMWCGNMKIVGYIEAKGLESNLDEAEKT